MKWLSLLPFFLLACGSDENGVPAGQVYVFDTLSGFTWVHKQGEVVDSFPTPDTLLGYYAAHVDRDFFRHMEIKVAGDSFFARTRVVSDLQPKDTTIAGRLEEMGGYYLGLIKEFPCDTSLQGMHATHWCLAKAGDRLSFNTCFDYLFQDSLFDLESIGPENGSGWNNLPGMKCDDRGFADDNMYRSEILITLRKK